MTNKFQTGGQVFFNAVANPFSDAAVADRTYSAAQSSKAATQELVPKELILELYKKGIPVDVDYVTQQLSRLEDRLNKGLPVTKAMTHSVMSKINKVLQNSKYLEDAEKYSESHDAIGEIAVGNYYGRGQLYVLDRKNDIKSIDLAQYDPEKHGPALTINELIEHRKFNPTQAFDTSLTRIINSNVGMSKINNRIQEIIKTVGSAETTSEAYTDLVSYLGQESAKRPTRDQLATLQSMASALQTLGPDAIFKNKQVFESKNVQDAFKYIESVLPRSEKMQLIGRYIANGGDRKNAEAYVQSLIINALNSSNDIKSGNYIDYESSINKGAGTQAGSKEAKQTRNLKNLEILIQGSLNKVDYNLVSSKDPSVGMTLHGNRVGALTNFDNNIIPKAPVSTAIESSLGPLVDKQHVTMGSQKISESMFDTILYDGNDVINIWAPVNQNGDIDLNGLQQFNELLEYFDSDASLTTADKNSILAKYGIQGKIDNNGNFVGSGNMAQFLVFTGITSDEVIDSSDKFVDILPDQDKEYELDQIERIYGYINSKNKNKDSHLKFKKGWFDWSTDILRAPVFMRLKSTAQTEVGTFSNHGPIVSTRSYDDYVAMDQMKYNQSKSQQQIYTPSTSLLFE